MTKKRLYTPTPTVHIAPKEGTSFADTVLFPGDPLRAKWIAEEFLEDSILVNEVRGMCAYTGNYLGKPLSVMGSGMGMPSVGIYSHELFKHFGVDNIIRVGTAGGISEDVKVGDVVLAMSASTDSSWQDAFVAKGHYAPTADFDLLRRGVIAAYRTHRPFHVGGVFATDNYYHSDIAPWRDLGCLCCDMESAALYSEATVCKKHALTILTVSNIIGDYDSETSPEERERSFADMVEVALGTVVLSRIETEDSMKSVRDYLQKLVGAFKGAEDVFRDAVARSAEESD